MKNNQRKGITIVTLVITIIILMVLTGAVMLTMNNSDIFGQTINTVDEHNKQAMIEQIQMKIQEERLAKINRGETGFTIKEDVIPVVETFGIYEDNTLKLTIATNEIEMYLYEILEIKVEEYVTAVYKDKQFTLTEKEESLSSNGYKYEYTYDNGLIWQTYIAPVTIQEQSGIKVRLVNSEGQVISNEYVATKGAMRKNVAAVGIVSDIDNLKDDKCVYICSLNEDNIPNLYQATCNNIKNITKLGDDIYIVQQNELLIAVTTGLVFESMISQDEGVEYDDESFRSYG